MTERYVSHCICQACKAKLINIKPRDLVVTKCCDVFDGNCIEGVSVAIPYLSFRWCIYDGVKVIECYIDERAGLAISTYDYPSIAEWARRVVIRFETRLRLYSKRLGR